MMMYLGVQLKEDVENGRKCLFAPARLFKGELPQCLIDGDCFYAGSGQKVYDRDACYENYKKEVARIVNELNAKRDDGDWVDDECVYRVDGLNEKFTGLISFSYGADNYDWPNLEIMRAQHDFRFGLKKPMRFEEIFNGLGL